MRKSSATGCDTPALSFSGGSFTLAANATSVTKLVEGSVSMGSSSNDCQGKDVEWTARIIFNTVNGAPNPQP